MFLGEISFFRLFGCFGRSYRSSVFMDFGGGVSILFVFSRISDYFFWEGWDIILEEEEKVVDGVKFIGKIYYCLGCCDTKV